MSDVCSRIRYDRER